MLVLKQSIKLNHGKKIMKKIFISTLTALAMTVGLGAGVAVASGKECGRYGHGDPTMQYGKGSHSERGIMSERMLERLDRKLELSESQQVQIKALLASRAEESDEQVDQRQKLREQSRELDLASPDYIESVTLLADAKAEAMKQRMMEHAQIKSEIYAILTPEQQAEFAEMKGPGSRYR